MAGEKRTRRAKADVVADIINAWPEGHDVIMIDPEADSEDLTPPSAESQSEGLLVAQSEDFLAAQM